MLVLTRKKGESIIIDDQIEVKVLEIEGNKIRLGISAPRSIEIHRQEIYEEIEAENKAAAQQIGADFEELAKILSKQD